MATDEHREAAAEPPFVPVLTVMVDYENAFLWLVDRPGQGGVGPNWCDGSFWDETFPMSEGLWCKFADWAIEFDRMPFYSDDCDTSGWDWGAYHERGLQLTRRLKEEVGDAYHVLYQKPGEDPDCQIDERREVLADGTLLPWPSLRELARAAWNLKMESAAHKTEELRKTIAVAFTTPKARDAAMSLLGQKTDWHACIIAPKELATDDWARQAAQYCQSWQARYLHDYQLSDTIEALALIDELNVIAGVTVTDAGCDLKLPKALEDLLWLADEYRIESRYYSVDPMREMNPKHALVKRGVPERMTAWQTQRTTFTRQLTEIRLDNDFGSSGLWNDRGQNLSYDLLDLPFPLVKRIAAWQYDFDETVNPPDEVDEAWWQRHRQEKVEIAKELQSALGPGTTVKLYGRDGWLTVDEYEREGWTG